MALSRPQRYGFEDILASEMSEWETKYGEHWADEVEPEMRTTLWDFDSLQELKEFYLNSEIPAQYFSRAFERVNFYHNGYCWEWDTQEIELEDPNGPRKLST